jgi:hypothetical protein
MMAIHFFALKKLTLKNVENLVSDYTSSGLRGTGFLAQGDEMPLWLPKVLCRMGDLSPEKYMVTPGLLAELQICGSDGKSRGQKEPDDRVCD